MAIELATAYVSLVASARGIAASVASELGAPLDRAGRDAGDRLMRSMRKAVAGISLPAPEIPVPDAPEIPEIAAPDIATPQIPQPDSLSIPALDAPRIAKPEIPVPDPIKVPALDAPSIDRPRIPEPDTSGFEKGLKAAGVAGGAALTLGFLSSTSLEVSNDRLAAQMGIANPSWAGDLGKVAGQVYAANFGDSVDQVNTAIRSLFQQGVVEEDVTSAQLKGLAEKALGIANVFDQDVGPTVAAAGQLIRTGLAANAGEAFDVIVRGFQQGADKSGDLLDSLNEYSTQFRKLGLGADQATGILIQGLQAGARDSDVVADAIKEFSIRAVDGSKLTAQGFQQVGLDAEKMAAQIGQGGPAAAAGLDTVLDRLRAMPDPVARAQAAVALFGTQAEDLGASLFAIDPSKAVAALGDVSGAADRMNTIVGDNAASAFESFKRSAEVKLAGVTKAIGPPVNALLGVAPALGGLALVADKLPLAKVASGLVDVGKSAAVGTAKVVAQTAAFVAQKVASVAVAVATKAYTAAQWLLNAALTANPIGVVIVAIAALVAGVILAYKHSETFRRIVQAAFDALKAGAEFVGRVVVAAFDLLVGAFKSVRDWLSQNWDVVLAIITGPFGLAILIVRRFGDDIVGFFTELPGKLVAAAGDIFGWLLDQATKAKDWVSGRVGDIVGFITGIPGRLAGIAGNVFGWLKDQATGAKDWVGARVADVVGFFTGMPKKLADAAGDVFGFLWRSFRSAINAIIKGWNDLEFKLPSFGGLKVAGQTVIPGFEGPTLGTPNLPLLHEGGIVPGPRGADVLAILQAGERVIPSADVATGARAGLTIEKVEITGAEDADRSALALSREMRSLVHLLGA